MLEFDQQIIKWGLLWIGVTIWFLIALQFRKPRFIKEVKIKEVPIEKIKFIEVPKYITPKKVEVRREVK
jgi:hypothetical protein